PSEYSNQAYQLADINGDGVPDLIWTWNNIDTLGRVVWMGNPDGTGFPATYTSYTTQGGFVASFYAQHTYRMGDVNGDGKADLIWTWFYSPDGRVAMVTYLAKADGTGFGPTPTYQYQLGFNPAANANHAFLFGDVNGDGKPDLTWAWTSGDQVGRVLFLSK